MPLIKCRDCSYSHPKDPNQMRDKPLECRRYAPRMICGTGAGWSNWEWPEVAFEEGCGEGELLEKVYE